MGYKTLKAIRDLQDDEHYYRKGDVFPREGLTVPESRINELLEAGHIVPDENVIEVPKLKAVDTAIEETEVATEEVAKDLNRLNKTDLIAMVNEKDGVEVEEKDTKADLIAKLGE